MHKKSSCDKVLVFVKAVIFFLSMFPCHYLPIGDVWMAAGKV